MRIDDRRAVTCTEQADLAFGELQDWPTFKLDSLYGNPGAGWFAEKFKLKSVCVMAVVEGGLYLKGLRGRLGPFCPVAEVKPQLDFPEPLRPRMSCLRVGRYSKLTKHLKLSM